MSRTDQHAPFLVRIARGDLAALAAHDHRGGRCDLPVRANVFGQWPSRTRCTWEFVFSGTFTCCCSICHAGRQRKADRRAARHQDRVNLTRALGHWRAGRADAFDELEGPHRSHWW